LISPAAVVATHAHAVSISILASAARIHAIPLSTISIQHSIVYWCIGIGNACFFCLLKNFWASKLLYYHYGERAHARLLAISTELCSCAGVRLP
jgi:hypothetical protein